MRRATSKDPISSTSDIYKISIHALLAESDCSCGTSAIPWSKFLSTLSLRRATLPATRPARKLLNFYPRSPCGERLKASTTPFSDDPISIHALLAESDSRQAPPRFPMTRFLSTLSLRRATNLKSPCTIIDPISIHALLAESDGEVFASKPRRVLFLSTLSLRRATDGDDLYTLPLTHFYPRSPCGERRVTAPAPITAKIFLSTLSLRRATEIVSRSSISCQFLSTLSLRRATSPAAGKRAGSHHFYPRSPCGERP